MRYIRTKDNIWERNDVRDLTYGYRPAIIGGWEHTKALNKEDIIKEADTIEELCDEFVFVSDKWKIEHRCYFDLNSAITLCKKDELPITEINGAIWTDKGLIYVAKMNDNGELELL